MPIDLDTLASPDGDTIVGDVAGDRAANQVASAGDVNNDGYDDIIISAAFHDIAGSNAGAAYVLFGKLGGFGAIDLANPLAAADGFKIIGDNADDFAGNSVKGAGDVNGDGFADIIVGAVLHDAGGSSAGAAYVIFGKASGFGTIDLANPLAATAGFKIIGDAADDSLGTSVSGAGDFNNDGRDDIIVGAPYNDSGGSNSGAAYVIFGKATGATVDLGSALAAGDGFKIQGDTNFSYTGTSVSSAGDVDNDGYDDIIVGAKGHSAGGLYAGAAYVIFGKNTGIATVDLGTALAASDGFKIVGDVGYDYAGNSVSAAGDVNGDGFGDIIVGAYTHGGGGNDRGAAYVIFGKLSGFGEIDLANPLAAAAGFKIIGDNDVDRLGGSVAGAGDFNNDGFDDIIVGAKLNDEGGSDVGAAYVIYGKASGFATIDLSTPLAEADGFKILGAEDYDFAGQGVAGAGDTNGDGFDDLIVGAEFSDGGGGNSGAAYVIYGFSLNSDPTENANAGLALNEGATATITAAELDFDDAEQADTAITYTVTSVTTNGLLRLNGVGLAVSDTFTQDDIVNNLITYVHSGSETTSDSFGFSVADGAGGSVTGETFAFSVTAVNDAPVSTVPADGAISGPEGQDIAVTGLQVSDADAAAGAMIVVNVLVSAGTLHVAEGVPGGGTVLGNDVTPGNVLVLFGTLAEVNTTLASLNGVVLNGGPDFAGSVDITFTASDGGSTGLDPGLTGGPSFEMDVDVFTVTVTPVNDEPAENANTGLTLDEGTTATITAAELDFDDVEQADTAITYTVTSATAEGELQLSGVALAVNDTFTQDDLNNSLVTYVHDGGETTSDSFGFSVSDGIATPITGQSFAFTVTPVNDAPVQSANTGLTLDEDTTATITAAELDFDDAEQADTAITYTVTSATANGELRLSGVALAVNDTFTQDDLNNSLVTYVHDGGETTSDSFGFSVSDGAGGSVPGQSFAFTVTPVNDAPVQSANTGLTLDEDTTATITAAELDFDDAEQADTAITYTVTSATANGELRLSGVALAVNDTFTQDDLNNSLVTYVHDGGETTSDSFGFSVSDGAGGSVPGQSFAFTVNAVNDGPVQFANTGSTVDEGGTDTITIAELDFNDPDTPGATITYTITGDTTNGTLELNGVALGLNDTFTEDDINSGLVTYVHDGSDTTDDLFDFSVSDGAGGSTTGQSFAFTVAPVNDAPYIDLDVFAPAAFVWTEGDGATLLAPGAGFLDDDDDNSYPGAKLTVTNNGATAGDLLSIDGTGPDITLSGNDILYLGDIVGTWSGGDGVNPLVIDFNALACACAIELTMASILFENTDDLTETSLRTIDFTLLDGGGTALGGTDTGTASLELVVAPLAEVIAGPDGSGDEDTVIPLTGVVIDGVANDPANDVITVALSVADGTLTVLAGVPGGLDAGDIAGNDSVLVVLTGTQDAINATLAAVNGLTYQGDLDFSGSDTLSINAEGVALTGLLALALDDALPVFEPIFRLDAHDLVGNGTAVIVFSLDGGVGLTDFSFGVAAPLPEPGVPGGFAFGDFDDDGSVDLAASVTTSGSGDGYVALLTLASAGVMVSIADVPYAYDIATGDFNDDTLADLAITDGANGRVAILLQDPSGGFEPLSFTTPIADALSFLTVGDFNEDTFVDLLVSTIEPTGPIPPGSVSLLLGNGDGTFQAATEVLATPAPPGEIVAADFDDDGDLDFAYAAANYGGSGTNGVVVVLGNGDGTFAAPVDYDTTADGLPIQLVAADIDGDGVLDLAVANYDYSGGYTYSGSFSVLLGNGDGTFGAAVDQGTYYGPFAIASGDVDGDGDIDIVTGSYEGLVELFINRLDETSRSASATKPITIALVNDVPVLTLADDTISGTEDVTVVFNAANANAITVADVDHPTLTVTLSLAAPAADATLTLSQTTGLVVTGDGSALVTLSGSAADINAALEGLEYYGGLNFEGSDTLEVEVDDGVDPVTDTIAITLADDGIIHGNAANNVLSGTPAPDLFHLQQGGNDSVSGLASSDTFYFGAAFTGADSVDGGAGIADRILLEGDYTGGSALALGAGTLTDVETIEVLPGFDYAITTHDGNVAAGGNLLVHGANLGAGDILTFDGSAELDGSFTVFGGQGGDALTGGAGNDALNGRAGDDTLTGGAGNDAYHVDAAGDVVNEAAAGGTDIVYANVTYTLAAGTEIEVLSTSSQAATTAINLTGNEFGQTIYGNAGANVLNGAGGNDVLVGLDGIDTLNGGNDNDLLIGGVGNDTMNGGAGNDVFHVEAAGDVVNEAAASGTDVVYTGVSYTLTAGQEIETLSTSVQAATTAINLTGNAFGQTIYGNAGANVLNGAGGNDVLIGFGGNDIYHVDAAGDAVNEAAAGGTDVVYASASYALTAGAEVEILSTSSQAATTAINLVGNEFGQTIYGNAGANVLNGLGGNDAMVGLGGNDVYHVDAAGDAVYEAAAGGTDVVYAGVNYTLTAGQEVETLSTSLLAGVTAIDLTGNALGQTIYGNAGTNLLDGKGGNDALVGLAGTDTFAFTTALGAGNVDAIIGFSVADDTIQLENAVFTGLAAGALAAGAFNTGPAATQADDRIIYNSATGALLFDADGSGAGAAVQFATLSTGLALAASDFLVI